MGTQQGPPGTPLGPSLLPCTKWSIIRHTSSQTSFVSHCTCRRHCTSTRGNTSACKAWTTYHLVRTITCDQFAAAIDDVFYAILDNPIKGLNGIDLRTLVHHIATMYTQIGQPDLDDNLANFSTGIDPGSTLAVFMRKQEHCQVFALDAAVPISEATMVATRTKHAHMCGNITMAWHEWNCCAIPNHTWPNWKTY